MDAWICFLFFFSVTVSSLGGLLTAAILKRLDNVVKEYTGNMANVVTAISSSFLFPDKFQLTRYIATSLFLLLTGIYLYEMFKISHVPKRVVTTTQDGDDEAPAIIEGEKQALLDDVENNISNGNCSKS